MFPDPNLSWKLPAGALERARELTPACPPRRDLAPASMRAEQRVSVRAIIVRARASAVSRLTLCSCLVVVPVPVVAPSTTIFLCAAASAGVPVSWPFANEMARATTEDGASQYSAFRIVTFSRAASGSSRPFGNLTSEGRGKRKQQHHDCVSIPSTPSALLCVLFLPV